MMTNKKHMCASDLLWFASKYCIPTTTLKIDPRGVMLKLIKDLSVTSSSPIGFEVEWHNSQSNKWYQTQGHGFKSRECHCEGGIVEGTTIWPPKTTLKIGLCDVMSKLIKDLSVSFSSPIGFELEWHSSQFDILKRKKN